MTDQHLRQILQQSNPTMSDSQFISRVMSRLPVLRHQYRMIWLIRGCALCLAYLLWTLLGSGLHFCVRPILLAVHTYTLHVLTFFHHLPTLQFSLLFFLSTCLLALFLCRQHRLFS